MNSTSTQPDIKELAKRMEAVLQAQGLLMKDTYLVLRSPSEHSHLLQGRLAPELLPELNDFVHNYFSEVVANVLDVSRVDAIKSFSVDLGAQFTIALSTSSIPTLNSITRH